MRVPGVGSVAVNLVTEKATVHADAAVSDDQLIAAIVKVGYEAAPILPDARPPAEARGFDGELTAVADSALLTLPLLAPMFGADLSPWLQLVLASIVQFGLRLALLCGRLSRVAGVRRQHGFCSSRSAHRQRGAFLSIRWPRTAGGAMHLFFGASAVVITLVRFGKWLKARAKRPNATPPIRSARSMRCVRPPREREIPLADVTINDIVIVRPGERVPVDGIVREGRTHIDESLITGESLAGRERAGRLDQPRKRDRHRNDRRRRGDDARAHHPAGRIGAGEKSPIQRLVDRVSAVFVPAILGIALITLAG